MRCMKEYGMCMSYDTPGRNGGAASAAFGSYSLVVDTVLQTKRNIFENHITCKIETEIMTSSY